jgi:Delta3-Delta2-enoyl-CoA isomerase
MIEIEDAGGIRTLRLARPPVNALNRTLLARLDAEVAAAPAAGIRGLVLTGAGGRYCAGLDLAELVALDERGLVEFLGIFFDCLMRLAESPIPIAAAINGHSPAGGCVLALFCDRRVMAAGEYRIGLNEVQVGLYPGAMIHAVLARAVGARVAAEMLPEGALLDAKAALAVGLVDELAPLAAVEAGARAWLERTLALPARAYALTRALVRVDLIAAVRELGREQLELSAALWSEPETRATLRALLAKLSRR